VRRCIGAGSKGIYDNNMSDTAPSSGQPLSVGKFRLIASLGQGGMADVYLAVASGVGGFNKLQVLKRLRPDRAEEQGIIEMFLDEARLAAQLNHPNVVSTLEVCEDGQDFFMVMEYLDGTPFNRLLAKAKATPPPPGILLKIIAEALTGLHYAHELNNYDGKPLNIVHRDVSPHNVFVTFDGHTKESYLVLPNAPMFLNGTVLPKVSYVKDRFVTFVYVDSGQIEAFNRVNVLGELTGNLFTYEYVEGCTNGHRLVFFNLDDCVNELRVRLVQSVSLHNFNPNNKITIKPELNYLLLEEAYKWFVPEAKTTEDKVIDGRNDKV